MQTDGRGFRASVTGGQGSDAMSVRLTTESPTAEQGSGRSLGMKRSKINHAKKHSTPAVTKDITPKRHLENRTDFG